VAHVDVVSDKEEVKQDLIGEIDDKVLQMASSFRSIPLDRTALPALTDQSFFELTKDKPLLLVLFYVHCMFTISSSSSSSLVILLSWISFTSISLVGSFVI